MRHHTVTSSPATANLKSQLVTSSSHGGRRYRPYAFTEQGVAMLYRLNLEPIRPNSPCLPVGQDYNL